MVTLERARQIASEWHGGQFTALYSLSSTDHLDRFWLFREIKECLDYPRISKGNARSLIALQRYVDKYAPEDVDDPS